MKQVIILEKLDGPRTAFKFALWATVPLPRQPFYANPNRVSAFKNATAQELQDIKDGKVTEKIDVVSVEPGVTVATIQVQLQTAWQSFQDQVTNETTYTRYGSFWDGTAWTASGF
jgi:hypothetical protein